MNDIFNEVDKIFKDDLYKLKLSISDHVMECSGLYLHKFKLDKEEIQYYRELMDLYILLKILYKNDDSFNCLHEQRINKFISKNK